MTPGIDDPGAWQHQVDQAHVHEVVGQFVDEEGLAEVAVDARLLQVLLAQGQEIGGLHVRQDLRIACAIHAIHAIRAVLAAAGADANPAGVIGDNILSVTTGEQPRGIEHVRQFHRAFHQ